MLQLNYESMRRTGVRNGIATLLSDEKFYDHIRTVAAENRLLAGSFKQTLDARGGRPETPAAVRHSSSTGIQGGVVDGLQSAVRNWLDHLPGTRPQHHLKYQAENFPYLCRVCLLGLKPTTPRSLVGTTLASGVDSIDAFARLARSNGSQLVFAKVTRNPGAVLYKTQADREHYSEAAHEFARRCAVPMYDFEQTIPASGGFWIDGKDPIHLGRAAHRRKTQLPIDSRMFDASLN